jgi:hypothetical protein
MACGFLSVLISSTVACEWVWKSVADAAVGADSHGSVDDDDDRLTVLRDVASGDSVVGISGESADDER